LSFWVKLTRVGRLSSILELFGKTQSLRALSRAFGPRRPSRRGRAVELLAASRDGCTEAIMLAHDFTGETTAALIRGGAPWRRPGACAPATARSRLRITDAGRRALEEKWLAARNEDKGGNHARDRSCFSQSCDDDVAGNGRRRCQ
jgi:hypothetical protein